MATTRSLEKRPDETVPSTEDFASLLQGADIQPANIDVSVLDAETDADVTSTILVTGSPAVSGTAITCRLQAGTDGKLYSVRSSTGLTTNDTDFTKETLLLVTTTPSRDTLLSDVESVKTRLRITDNTDDVVLLSLLQSASDYFKARVGRKLIYGEQTEILYHQEDVIITNETRLQLTEWPVRLIRSVILRTDPTDTSPTTVAANDIVFDIQGFVWLRNGMIWRPFPHENVITYRAGYSRIPADIRGAVEAITAFFYRILTREGLSSERIGEYSYTRRSLGDFPRAQKHEMPDAEVEGVIDRYRRTDIEY